MSDWDFTGKRLLLLGSCGVLGQQHTKYFVERGANLVIADRPGSNLSELASRYSVQYCEIDCSDEQSIVQGVQCALSLLGGIDGAIYNSAITGDGLSKISNDPFPEFDNYPLSLWNEVLNVNLTGAFLFSREIGRVLKNNPNGGSLILVSSIYGVVSPDHRIYDTVNFNCFPSYSASKAGLIGLMRWLATLWSPHGVRVNCVSPGGVFNNQESSFVNAYSGRVPMGRMARSTEISSALAYLLSDSAGYCTGQNLVIDGGLTAW